MINLGKGSKCLKAYILILFEAGPEVHSIYYPLSNIKLQFGSCLNHLTRPKVTNQNRYPSFGRGPHVNWGAIYKMFNILFQESDDSATLNKIKQNIHLLQENCLMK